MYKKYFFAVFISMLTTLGSIAQVLYIDSENASFINAAAFSPANDVICFFSGSAIMLYDINKSEIDETTWYKLKGFDDIQAAVTWTNDQILLFEKDSFRIFEVNTATFVGEKQRWSGLPEEWQNTIDAAVRWSEDEVMFFRNDDYLIYSFFEENYTVRGKCSEWDGWESRWESGLDAVFTIDGEFFFLNEGGALQFSLQDGLFYETTSIGFEVPKENK
ncbi:MAG: hypothetical protein C0593_01370 [Marinilabiliales bacterium]|nr:MAG: hypothetical protein C0593_01370 [Marinilabiliales bacterium]